MENFLFTFKLNGKKKGFWFLVNANLKEEDVEILAMDLTQMDLHSGAFNDVISKFGRVSIANKWKDLI